MQGNLGRCTSGMARISKEKFRKMKQVLLELNACDRCIGRQFRKAVKGHSNPEIGRAVRISDTWEEVLKNIKSTGDFVLGCEFCDSLFDKVNENASRIIELIQNYDFDTFLIGVRIPRKLQEMEDELWNRIGNEFAEPMKKELAREIGTIVSEKLGKKVDFSLPDITVIVDFNFDPARLDLEIRSLYIYGEYQKLERDIPQTKWICPKCHGKGCPYCNFMGKLYPTSVEEEIGRPLLDMTGGRDTRFHGAGREDRDALMLGWRPFIIEVLSPVVRKIDLSELERIVNSSGKVKIRNLKYSTREEVVKLKSAKFDKTYEAIVECPGYTKNDLSKIEQTFREITIRQRTPRRVAHRRADKVRERKVYSVSCEPLDENRFRAIIHAEHGTYIKELVSGDEGRTEPSFSSVMKKPCRVVELNVLEVHFND